MFYCIPLQIVQKAHLVKPVHTTAVGTAITKHATLPLETVYMDVHPGTLVTIVIYVSELWTIEFESIISSF